MQKQYTKAQQTLNTTKILERIKTLLQYEAKTNGMSRSQEVDDHQALPVNLVKAEDTVEA